MASHIGKLPIAIPAGVEVKIEGQNFSAKGAKGSDSYVVPEGITAAVEGNEIVLTAADDLRPTRAKHGLARSIMAGMVKGVHDGYSKTLEIVGTGYRAIAKGQLDAKKHMFSVPRVRGTITHPVQGHDAAGTVLLRPAAPGTGVIAGGSVRAVMECAGITDVLTKSMGSATAVNVVRATVDALKQLEEPEEIAARRGLALDEVAPDALLRARAAGIAEARKAREEAAAAKAAEEKDGE